MSRRNAYFQLKIVADSTYIVFFPAVEGGKAIDINEVTAYLDRNMLDNYNLKELADAARVADGKTEIKVGIAPVRPFSETVSINVSGDRMLAFARFYPPANGGTMLTANDIISDLQLAKIKQGIDREVIDSFLQEREYCREYILARGVPAVNGTEATIEYYFNTKLSTRPKKNEDGSVNYHELNTISRVEKGQKLAQIIDAVPGKDGYDIYGNIVKQKVLKDVRLEFGNNIELSEDRKAIYTTVTGHATLVSGKVFVSDVYDVPNDVDNSTGNIDYDGNVHIVGNVKSGFKVVAKGDIVVDGVVEGATLVAGGQIIIKRGIHGMTKGELIAKSNIMAKFIENATVTSGGYIETESILHSNVSAFSEIRVQGKKGFVNGGTIRAGKLIDAQIIGSAMGTQTKIEVGMDPQKKERYGILTKELDGMQKDLDKIKPILVTFTRKFNEGEELDEQKMQYVQQLAQQFKALQSEMRPIQEEMALLHQELRMNDDAKVRAHKDIYPGVSVTISDITNNIKSQRSYCQFVKKGAEIVVSNL